MKLSLLLVGISFIAAGVAGASTPIQTQSIPQPVVETLHNAFLNADILGMAEGIAYGYSYQSPVPANVQAIANTIKGACAIAQTTNNVQTISGSNCPISDKNSWNVTGDQTTANIQDADSFQINDPSLRSQLSLVSASLWSKGTQSQTNTTASGNTLNHYEIATTTNHKIVLDYTNTYNGTVTSGPNGESDLQVQYVNIAGTVSLDGQKHTGSMIYDAAGNGNYTCTADGAPIDCQTFTYIFGFVAPTVHR